MAQCWQTNATEKRQQLAVGNDIWLLLVDRELEKGHTGSFRKIARPLRGPFAECTLSICQCTRQPNDILIIMIVLN